MIRGCWSLDLEDDTKNVSDPEDQSKNKGKVLIGKIKRNSSRIFRSIEEDFSLNKGLSITEI